MPTNTPNHDIRDFDKGDEEWDHSDLVLLAEQLLAIHDAEANIDDYLPYEGATFVADEGGVVYDGDGEQWVKARREFAETGTDSILLADTGDN